MIARVIVYVCLLCSYHFVCAHAQSLKRKCLIGTMTDVQNWVGETGKLTVTTNALDLSARPNATVTIRNWLTNSTSSASMQVEYLSLAKCELSRVPRIFELQDTSGRTLAKSVRYLSLYGNHFADVSVAGKHYEVQLNATKATEYEFMGFPSTNVENVSLWSTEFQRTYLSELLELDLRACSIQTLNAEVFGRMPKLEMLYLSENIISNIDANAFRGLTNLKHLDISDNFELKRDTTKGLLVSHPKLFEDLTNLISLDLSYTKLNPSSVCIFKELGENFTGLSICETGLTELKEGVFNKTNIKYLDVSGNNGVLDNEKSLEGLEDSLEILYADSIQLDKLNVLNGFEKLEVLKISNNRIRNVVSEIASTWTELKILDLTQNHISSWFNHTYSLMPNLSFLSLVQNSINLMTEHMIKDIANLDYVGFSQNFIVCNCHVREFIDIAAHNERKHKVPIGYIESNFHTGFSDYNQIVKNRNKVATTCEDDVCNIGGEQEYNGSFLLFDYDKDSYKCLAFEIAKMINFTSTEKCKQGKRDYFEDPIMDARINLMLLWIIPALVFPILALGIVFRRWFIYCCITIRNSAMISLINSGEPIDDGTIFNYDVFVSYCNEDRAWVLDQLLPHVEKDCNVSVCLHERDFQVGLSILENIVSCMDRSKSIMLVISQKFLMSQWCQFEMHLAQHRLLETRREDLILILLEKIPRHLRPNTLHYLMLTKTYIVWPKEKSEREIFWRRMDKALTTQRIKRSENISLA